MYTTINNTTMEPVVTTEQFDVAMAWAETIPFQNDFSVITHTEADLKPYSVQELDKLNKWLAPHSISPAVLTREVVVRRALTLLTEEQGTSELPPDGKRVATLSPYQENEMATRKKASTKKVTTKKTATKKAPTKKVTAKKPAAPKVERNRQNGVLEPKPDSQTGQIFVIADALSKKAGEPAKRADVVAAGEGAGIKTATCTAAYQIWRKFHGLVK